jgi:hypothetical protein
MSNEYLVAKYISSPVRMEPRNIGVFVKSGENWLARFLGEQAEGDVDRRRVKGIVEHSGAYEQWVGYWRHLMHSVRPAELAAALKSSSKANFAVSDGPNLFLASDAVESADRTLEYLYHLIVAEFPEQRPEELNLARRVDDVIDRFNLKQNPHFQEQPSVRCEVQPGIVEHVRPNYGYRNGREVYFQKVSINPYRPERTQKDVHNAAWIFDRLRFNAAQRETNTIVQIVRAEPPREQALFSVDEYLAVLGTVSEVVDVDDERAVDRVFAPLAA